MLFSRFLLLLALVACVSLFSAASVDASPISASLPNARGEAAKGKKGDAPPRPRPKPGPQEGGDDD